MEKTSLGDRMKEFYENRTKTYLTRRTPVIIRCDGVAFHTFTKGLKKPFDLIFIEAMQRTTLDLCKKIQGCKFGYVESDEISLVLTDYDTLTTAAWFDYSNQKLCSVAASLATLYFNKNFAAAVQRYESALNTNPEVYQESSYWEYLDLLKKKVETGGYFDARAFNIPKEEITNYFIWRQQDASRNSIQSLARAHFSQKELMNLNNSQLQDLLHEKKGINWNNCTTIEKRGSGIIYQQIDETNSSWIIDNDIPIFTADRNYIESRLPN